MPTKSGRILEVKNIVQINVFRLVLQASKTETSVFDPVDDDLPGEMNLASPAKTAIFLGNPHAITRAPFPFLSLDWTPTSCRVARS